MAGLTKLDVLKSELARLRQQQLEATDKATYLGWTPGGTHCVQETSGPHGGTAERVVEAGWNGRLKSWILALLRPSTLLILRVKFPDA